MPSTLRSLCGVRLGDLLGLARGGYRRGSLAHLAAIQAGSLSGFRGEERGDPAAWLASASPDIGKRAADQRRSGTASAGTAQAIPARTADNTLGSPVTTPELTVTGTFRPQYRESQRHGRSCRVHQTHPGGQERHGHSPGRHPRSPTDILGDRASRAIGGDGGALGRDLPDEIRESGGCGDATARTAATCRSAPAMASAGTTIGCPRASYSWTSAMMSASPRATAVSTLVSRIKGVRPGVLTERVAGRCAPSCGRPGQDPPAHSSPSRGCAGAGPGRPSRPWPR